MDRSLRRLQLSGLDAEGQDILTRGQRANCVIGKGTRRIKRLVEDGGFLYYEVLEMLQALAKRHEVVGIDLVEVAPDYDHSGNTATLSAQILLNFLGFIFRAREMRVGVEE